MSFRYNASVEVILAIGIDQQQRTGVDRNDFALSVAVVVVKKIELKEEPVGRYRRAAVDSREITLLILGELQTEGLDVIHKIEFFVWLAIENLFSW